MHRTLAVNPASSASYGVSGRMCSDSPADYRTGTRETWTVFDAERSEAFDDTARADDDTARNTRELT